MLKKIARKCQNILSYIFNSPINIKSNRGIFYIYATRGHSLKNHLKKFNLYDRFLPYLLKYANTGLIDIGANIGDTMTLVKAVTNSNIVCIEPDLQFRKLIKKNITANNFSGVTIYPYPITSVNKRVVIKKNSIKSTGSLEKSLKNGYNNLSTKTFSEMVKDLQLNLSDYGVIKIDTDGYDWDVLRSIKRHFDQSEDLSYIKFIFFEFQTYDNNIGLSDSDSPIIELKFMNILEEFCKIGFSSFYLFDNFGCFFYYSEKLSDLKKFNQYLLRTNNENNNVPIYFFDVLVCRSNDKNFVEGALSMYYNNKIKIY